MQESDWKAVQTVLKVTESIADFTYNVQIVGIVYYNGVSDISGQSPITAAFVYIIILALVRLKKD